MARLLCVDDDPANLAYLQTLLAAAGHEVVTAADGVDALEKGRDGRFDLVITDILMPRMDGYRLAMEFRADSELSSMPIVFYTASYTDPADEDFADLLGAARFVLKPAEPSALLAVVSEVIAGASTVPPERLQVQEQRDLLAHYSDRLVSKLEDKVGELQRTLDGVIGAMVRVVEIRDPYTAGHQERVATLAAAIATRMQLQESVVDAVRITGLLHDIGKLTVPAEILSKPGRLTAAEFELIKAHPSVSMEILGSIYFPWPVAVIARQHHERLDGSGYPDGISAKDIGIESRILAVADIVEAMSSHRPYRPAHGIEAALQEVREKAGATLDDEVVRACAALFEEDGFDLDDAVPDSAVIETLRTRYSK